MALRHHLGEDRDRDLRRSVRSDAESGGSVELRSELLRHLERGSDRGASSGTRDERNIGNTGRKCFGEHPLLPASVRSNDHCCRASEPLTVIALCVDDLVIRCPGYASECRCDRRRADDDDPSCGKLGLEKDLE